MEKTAFWQGFEKRAVESTLSVVSNLPSAIAREVKKKLSGKEKTASTWGHAAELAGLSTLAVPSVQGLRGKHMDESTKHKLELGGLGILAGPSALSLGKKIFRRGK